MHVNIIKGLLIMKFMKTFWLVILTTLICSCGTTSNMKSPDSSANIADLSHYEQVIVNDFEDNVSKSGNDDLIVKEGKKFADIIASSVRSKNSFKKVDRNITSEEFALLIDGKINKYEKGNAAMRTLIGFGAGSSKFNAIVDVKDNQTKKLLGRIDVSKMSWLLGGIAAGSQDVESHMDSAASKIADECTKSKNYKNKIKTEA